MAFDFFGYNPAFGRAQEEAKYAGMSRSGLEGFNRLQKAKELGIPVGADSPMAQSTPSGRSYMDPERTRERWARQEDRARRQSLANMGAGGGRSGGGGGGGGAPMSLMDQINSASPLQKPIQSWQDFVRRPQYTQANMRDLATLKRAQSPNLLPGVAEASTRMQTGTATIGDFGTVERANNPTNPEAANAAARLRFNQRGGLLGNIERALYS